MSIIVKEREYENPEPDTYDARCVDVIDLGLVKGQYGVSRQVKLLFEINSAMKNGDPFIVQRMFIASLSRSKTGKGLLPFLESWRGRAFTKEEMQSFDLENVKNKACRLVVVHTFKDGKTYANISVIMPIKAGSPPYAASGTYKRSEKDALAAQQAVTDEAHILNTDEGDFMDGFTPSTPPVTNTGNASSAPIETTPFD